MGLLRFGVVISKLPGNVGALEKSDHLSQTRCLPCLNKIPILLQCNSYTSKYATSKSKPYTKKPALVLVSSEVVHEDIAKYLIRSQRVQITRFFARFKLLYLCSLSDLGLHQMRSYEVTYQLP